MKNLNKKLLMLSACMLTVFSTVQANQVTINNADKTGVTLVTSDAKSIELVFTFNEYSTHEVLTPRGKASILSLEEGSPIMKQGAPDIEKWTTSVIISETGRMDLEVIDEKFVTFSNIDIAPSKGNLFRNQDPSQVPFYYGTEYQTDAFFPGSLAELRKPYILRDYRGQTIVVNPLQYNPVTKTLRVYTQIRIRLIDSGEPGENPIQFKAPKQSSSEYTQIYQHQFLNYQIPKYSPVEESGNYLIICPDKYMEAIRPLADWKNKRGLVTEIVEFSAANTGTSAEGLKEYIRNYYQQKGITFLLLVGDANDIPSMYSSGDSDVAYAYMAGNDSYPEFFIGRMSGSTITHIQNQVEKSIYYERDIDESATWLSKGMVIASDEGGGGLGDDGESDKQHMEKIKSDLLSFTYEQVTTAYDPGATATQVSNAINSGLSNINYVGHGADTYWVTTGFDVTDCNNLTNYQKFPFVFDVACVNGNFHGQTCFAEAFMQARKNNQPTGALAIIASTINQSWDPPMDGQDEMIDILIESYENNIKRTFGGIAYNGCLHMNDEYGSSGEEMTDTWTTFGDPSVLVRTKAPKAIEVLHADELRIGIPSFIVSCDEEHAQVCLSHQQKVIAMAEVVNGEALLEFEPFIDVADLDLVVTGFNLKTHQSIVKVIPAEGPYISMIKSNINDRYGNNNGLADSGEEVFVDVQIKNIGVEVAGDVKVDLSTSDEFVQIIQSTHSFGTLKAGSQTGNSQLKVRFSENTPNQHQAACILTFTDSLNNQWIRKVEIVIQAPLIGLDEVVLIEDGSFGDGNNTLEPGESGFLALTVLNSGNRVSEPFEIRWEASSPYLALEQEQLVVEPIKPGQSSLVKLKVFANTHTPQGTKVSLKYDISSVDSLKNSCHITVGQAPLWEIGNGTTKKYQYPFYNYYKSNKTQILFLANEFASGTHLINELAFKLASVTYNSAHRTLKNFNVVLGTTIEQQIGNGYITIENPDTVLYQDSLELGREKGWFALNIDPYNYQTTKGNLIVEIYWGVNESYCASTDRTSVFCTETTVPTVAYGYADNEYPANFDGANNIRPNVKFSFIDQNVKKDTLSLVVIDNMKVPVSGALLTMGSQQWLTGEEGMITTYLSHGMFEVSASKNGYYPLQKQVALNDTLKSDTLVLQAYENMYEVSYQITDGFNPLQGANVTFNKQQLISDSNGELTFDQIPEGPYNLKIELAGFHIYENDLFIFKDTLITVILSKIPTYLVTFEFTENESFLPGVNVLFNNEWVVSQANGNAAFGGITTTDTLIYYIEKWGYYSQSDTLYGIHQDSILAFEMKKIPDLMVHVTHKFGNMEKAKVTFQNQSIYSNSLGEAIFEDVVKGTHQQITLECQGYVGTLATIDVADSDQTFEAYLYKKTDVTLFVTNGQSPMPGINVVLGTKEKVTDEQGKVVFKSNDEESQVTMSINHSGNYPVTRVYDFVKDVDIEETITLEIIPDLEFTLLLEEEPMSGITLNFNGTNWVSNQQGKILLTDVPKGTYSWMIAETGYYEVQDTLTIESIDMTHTVELKIIPDVSFSIWHNGEAEVAVSVTLADQVKQTSVSGTTTFTDIPEGIYQYIITKEGFNQITGELTVGEDDIQMDVNIFLVSVASGGETLNYQTYPNPSNGMVILEYPGNDILIGVAVYDAWGRKIKSFETGTSKRELDLTGLPAGMYWIVLQTAQDAIPIRQIID